MIWLFKINEVFWGDKPKVNEHYVLPDIDNIEFDITLYDISLYMATANYFLLNDTNPDEIYYLQYSGINSNPSRLSVGKNTDYYYVVSNYYIDKSNYIDKSKQK
jgi:hypothetical protein